MSLLRFNKIITIVCFCAFLISGAVSVAYAKVYLKEVTFSKSKTDAKALFKAQELFTNYLARWNMGFEEAPDFAQYIDLKDGRGKNPRFIAYYRQEARYNDCAAGGCTLLVFENFEQSKWRLVLQVSTFDLFISTNKATNGLQDIYMTGSGGKKIRWAFNGKKYVLANEQPKG